MPIRFSALAGGLLVGLPLVLSTSSAQETLPWQRNGAEPPYQQRDDAYRPNEGAQRYGEPDAYPPNRPNDPYSPAPRYGTPAPNDAYSPAPRYSAPAPNDAYSPRYASPRPPADDAYRPPQNDRGYDNQRNANPNDAYVPPRTGYSEPSSAPGRPYGQPYTPAPESYDDPRERRYGANDYGRREEPGPGRYEEPADGSYSTREILDAGHGFFGSVSRGLASVVEYVFQKQGRPNGYILGQEAGGALIAGLRYGEGILYTKDAGSHRVYWQGPSIGYDAGAEGSKVMMLVYDLRDPEEIYQRFGGVDGSAYFIGGVGVTFQKSGHIVVAPIRSGVGLRLGANIGYLKYTHRPTWNPF